uniref:GATA-type domain-containing protein n=1 Tax=Meloidogyne hapla TaxID=6305 RepID=A0A1I8C054_MELHA
MGTPSLCYGDSISSNIPISANSDHQFIPQNNSAYINPLAYGNPEQSTAVYYTVEPFGLGGWCNNEWPSVTVPPLMVEPQLFVSQQDDGSAASSSQLIPIQYPDMSMVLVGNSNSSGLLLQQQLTDHECTSCGRLFDHLGKDALGYSICDNCAQAAALLQAQQQQSCHYIMDLGPVCDPCPSSSFSNTSGDVLLQNGIQQNIGGIMPPHPLQQQQFCSSEFLFPQPQHQQPIATQLSPLNSGNFPSINKVRGRKPNSGKRNAQKVTPKTQTKHCEKSVDINVDESSSDSSALNCPPPIPTQKRQNLVCSNCKGSSTTLWRRDQNGQPVCKKRKPRSGTLSKREKKAQQNVVSINISEHQNQPQNEPNFNNIKYKQQQQQYYPSFYVNTTMGEINMVREQQQIKQEERGGVTTSIMFGHNYAQTTLPPVEGEKNNDKLIKVGILEEN